MYKWKNNWLNNAHPAVHRSTTLRGMLRDSRLIVAPSETVDQTQIRCIMSQIQREKIIFIYILPEGAEP